jgi:hypothetical protein
VIDEAGEEYRKQCKDARLTAGRPTIRAASRDRPVVAGALVRPELIMKMNYLIWTLDNLLRQVAYVAFRGDNPARDVQRAVPHPKTQRTEMDPSASP